MASPTPSTGVPSQAGGHACGRGRHRRVALVDHARAERPGLDQVQRDGFGDRREERRAATDDDRIAKQAQLVDEAELDRRRSQAGATDLDVLVGHVERRGDLLGHRRLGEPGVAGRCRVRLKRTFGIAHQTSANAAPASLSRSDGSVSHTSIVVQLAGTRRAAGRSCRRPPSPPVERPRGEADQRLCDEPRPAYAWRSNGGRCAHVERTQRHSSRGHWSARPGAAAHVA